MRYLFVAESPKNGELRRYEALLEFSDPNPHAIVSDDRGVDEAYHAGDDGFEELLGKFHQAYPSDG